MEGIDAASPGFGSELGRYRGRIEGWNLLGSEGELEVVGGSQPSRDPQSARSSASTDLVHRWAADTHNHAITGADELQGRHIAAKPKPPSKLCNLTDT